MAKKHWVTDLLPAEKAEILREVYRKHATTLDSIENAQQRFILLVLGIFGAAASFIAAKGDTSLELWTKVGITFLAGGIVVFSYLHTKARDKARKGTRALLTRCETFLGLYESGAFAPNDVLYKDTRNGKVMDREKHIQAGGWLGKTVVLVLFAAIGFLAVVWSQPL